MSKDNREKVLEVKKLTVQYNVGQGLHFNATRNISFDIKKGEVVGLVGESGSGKSTTAKAILGLAPHSTGSVKINGELVPNRPQDIKGRVNKWLASKVQMIFQDAKSSLNPREKVFDVIVEGAKNQKLYTKQRLANKISFAEKFIDQNENLKGTKTYELFKAEVYKDKKLVAQKHKHEEAFSEIFTIYDDERVILSGIKLRYKADRNSVKTSYKQFTHALKSQLNSDMLKPKKDAAEETREFSKISLKEKLINKKNARTQRNLKLKYEIGVSKDKLSMELENLKSIFDKEYSIGKAKFTVISNDYKAKKSLVARDNKDAVAEIKGDYKQLVNDIKTNMDDTEASKAYLGEYATYKKENKKTLTKKSFYRAVVKEVMDKVSISSEHINRYPGEFSGGQAQRIAIARTLAMKSDLIIADEPISALDVSIQAQVINLLKKLIKEENLTVMFIAHDLQVVRYISDRIIVMYKGELIEKGDAQEIYNNPKHPYTQTLIHAIPSIDDPDRIRNSKPYKAEHIENFSNYGEVKKEWHKINDDHEIFGTKAQIARWTK